MLHGIRAFSGPSLPVRNSRRSRSWISRPFARESRSASAAAAFKQRRNEALLAEARTRVRQWLDQFTEKCRAAGVRHQELMETGLPSECILSAAADIDITLLGQETHFHFETQPTPCETLKAVLRGSNRPVVVVPLKAPSGNSIVVAYDATPPSVRALHAFQASGLDEGARFMSLALRPMPVSPPAVRRKRRSSCAFSISLPRPILCPRRPPRRT